MPPPAQLAANILRCLEELPATCWRVCVVDAGEFSAAVAETWCSKHPGKLDIITWSAQPSANHLKSFLDLFYAFFNPKNHPGEYEAAFRNAFDKAAARLSWPSSLILSPGTSRKMRINSGSRRIRLQFQDCGQQADMSHNDLLSKYLPELDQLRSGDVSRRSRKSVQRCRVTWPTGGRCRGAAISEDTSSPNTRSVSS